jgi:hypothetical protein
MYTVYVKELIKVDFFVACEAENDCPFGGWLHPECTEDLKNLAREIIDNMGAWYCAACT